MLNGYLNLKKIDRFSPYLTVGIGGSINKAGDLKLAKAERMYALGDQKRNFAWQIGVGSLMKINSNMSTDLKYKYVDLGVVTTKGVIDGGVHGTNHLKDGPAKGKLRAHEISVGINYKFN